MLVEIYNNQNLPFLFSFKCRTWPKDGGFKDYLEHSFVFNICLLFFFGINYSILNKVHVLTLILFLCAEYAT